MEQERNFYGEAIGVLEVGLSPAEAAQVNAAVASAKANLALCDAIYAPRDHVEVLATRMKER